MKWLRIGSAGLAVVAFAACDSFDGLTDLEVVNQNAADRARVLQTWGDNENFVLGAFSGLFEGMHGGSPSNATGAAADEVTVSWGNFGGQDLSSEPRREYNNAPSYRFSSLNTGAWYPPYEALSNLYDGLRSFANDTTGQACIEVDCDRLFAFGKFVQGYAHAWLAAFYDSAFVLDETIDLFDANGDAVEQPFVDYNTMMSAAMGYFDDAITAATGGTWEMRDGVFGGSGNRFDGTEMAMLANTMKAFWLPMVARTPAERAALNWNSIIAAANAGMPGDVMIEGDGCNNWCADYVYYSHVASASSWNRADYKTIGQYDENSLASNGVYGYQDWVSGLLGDRNDFRMPGHPDRRIMGAGDTDGTTDGTDFVYRGPSRFPASRGLYHYSMYSADRWEAYTAAESGPVPWVMRTTIDMALAEGILRTTGMSQQVADLINATRVTRGGLPALTAATPAAVAMDALKYERIIESFGTCPSCGFFLRRGDGGLASTQGYVGNDPAGIPGGFDKDGNPIQHHRGPVEGTPGHFAPPGRELEVLVRQIYTYGGVGNELGVGQGLGAPPSEVAAFGKGTPLAFYIPLDEQLKRREARQNKTLSLIRYVQ